MKKASTILKLLLLAGSTVSLAQAAIVLSTNKLQLFKNVEPAVALQLCSIIYQPKPTTSSQHLKIIKQLNAAGASAKSCPEVITPMITQAIAQYSQTLPNPVNQADMGSLIKALPLDVPTQYIQSYLAPSIFDNVATPKAKNHFLQQAQAILPAALCRDIYDNFSQWFVSSPLSWKAIITTTFNASPAAKNSCPTLISPMVAQYISKHRNMLPNTISPKQAKKFGRQVSANTIFQYYQHFASQPMSKQAVFKQLTVSVTSDCDYFNQSLHRGGFFTPESQENCFHALNAKAKRYNENHSNALSEQVSWIQRINFVRQGILSIWTSYVYTLRMSKQSVLTEATKTIPRMFCTLAFSGKQRAPAYIKKYIIPLKAKYKTKANCLHALQPKIKQAINNYAAQHLTNTPEELTQPQAIRIVDKISDAVMKNMP
jgi:hypothetical protein